MRALKDWIVVAGLPGLLVLASCASTPEGSEALTDAELAAVAPATEAPAVTAAADAAAPQFTPRPGGPSAFSGDKPPVVARMDAVQLPASLLRRGVKAGVKPGWAIYAGDRIATGRNGRLVMTFLDGSRLKLGSDAEMELAEPWPGAGATTDRTASRIVRGAFHFAPSPVSRPGTVVPTLAVGETIRIAMTGGQVWGKSETAQDRLVLIEGALEARVSDRDPLRMTQPRSELVVPRARPPRPVTPVAAEKLALWLPQADLQGGRPVLAAEGSWTVSVAAHDQPSVAEGIACRLQDRGYPTELAPVTRDGKAWQRVVIRRFASKEDAVGFTRSARELGIAGAWIIPPPR